jgi:DnaJ-class molecular chaperone
MTRTIKPLTVTIIDKKTGDEVEHIVPSKWIICPTCEGGGTDKGRSVECDGGGFTASEWNDQDPDFRQDYLAGVYDKPCEPCAGSGKVQTIDRKLCDKKLLAQYDQDIKEEREFRAMCAAERRMGA